MRRNTVPAALRQEVIRRAGNRCEYCGLSQSSQGASFHIDHIKPLAVGGETIKGNLALACASCSLRKGARQVGVDPESGQMVPLFNPRGHDYRVHFLWDSPRVVGRTPLGRATVEALGMNEPFVRDAHRSEELLGHYPPPEGWPEQDNDER
ncbi:MAG TPA: HNH endonuclease signature motif containing protein [Armatimonadota bacterium]|nr:HNH endonuclease signature motif containing protein [Armatimonadota bacterium]